MRDFVVEVWIAWEGLPHELHQGFVARMMDGIFKDDVATVAATSNAVIMTPTCLHSPSIPCNPVFERGSFSFLYTDGHTGPCFDGDSGFEFREWEHASKRPQWFKCDELGFDIHHSREYPPPPPYLPQLGEQGYCRDAACVDDVRDLLIWLERTQEEMFGKREIKVLRETPLAIFR